MKTILWHALLEIKYVQAAAIFFLFPVISREIDNVIKGFSFFLLLYQASRWTIDGTPFFRRVDRKVGSFGGCFYAPNFCFASDPS